jgi:hypothetical protein
MTSSMPGTDRSKSCRLTSLTSGDVADRRAHELEVGVGFLHRDGRCLQAGGLRRRVEARAVAPTTERGRRGGAPRSKLGDSGRERAAVPSLPASSPYALVSKPVPGDQRTNQRGRVARRESRGPRPGPSTGAFMSSLLVAKPLGGAVP